MTRDDEAEFTALVQRQWRFAFRVAYAVLLDPSDAEDAVQETFLKLYRNAGWRDIKNERAFLARIAWRTAIDRRRTASAERSGASMDAHPEPLSSEPGPEQSVVSADEQRRIHAMIDSLPEELRVPLILSGLDELTSREVAAILDIPEGTVRTRILRARQILREKMASARKRSEENRYA